jgi:YVTN family beta-propeller protein
MNQGGRRWIVTGVALAAMLGFAGTAAGQPQQTPPPQAGPGQGGQVNDANSFSPIGQGIGPAGKQTNLAGMPIDSAMAPDGSRLVVSNAGAGVQSLQLIDTSTGDVTQTLQYPAPASLYTGLAFSPDGLTLYASGGGNNLIRAYSVRATGLTERRSIPLPTTGPTGQPINPFPAGMAVTPDGSRLVVADQQADAVSVVDLASGAVHSAPIGHRPYDVVVSHDGHTAYLTDQGGNELSVVDLSRPEPVQRGSIPVGTHPNRLIARADGSTLYVANGDSDELSVVDTTTEKTTRTISVSPYPDAPIGSNPDAIALSEDGRTLYVANSGNNAVAFIDVRSGHFNGMIPTAWHPTSLAWTGTQLFITNAKGLGAGPNDLAGHPNPNRPDTEVLSQDVTSMMVGTLTRVPVPTGHLQDFTQQVRDNDGFPDPNPRPESTGTPSEGTNKGAKVRDSGVVPLKPGVQSPIKHVIYVVREGQSYDEELGSLGRGNGDAALNVFGNESTPNSRRLARMFGDFDNFYSPGEVGAQGWNWAVAGNSNDYSEQTWPAASSGRTGPLPAEGTDAATAPNRDPAHAYIWDQMADHHVPFRNYGVFTNVQPDGSSKAADPVLDTNTDHDYRGFDLACPDSPGSFAPAAGVNCGNARFAEWKKEFDGYVADNNLPAAELIRLPNDRNAGPKPGSPTPAAYVADNDWALGQIVDAVSHSEYWSSTVIFVTEVDSNSGGDHVDGHRTVAQVISPYSHAGRVDSTFYSTVSMLRTVELILGLPPLTQYDAATTPMVNAFTSKPDLTPYTAVKPSQNMQEVNHP